MKSADLPLCDSQVCLPASVLEHIESSECVFKVSSSVKTSRGVGKIAMTQRRLFLLTDGRPGYVEVAQYRDLEVKQRDQNEIKMSQRKVMRREIWGLLSVDPVGGEGVLGSLPAPANPQPEAASSGAKGGV